MSHEKLISQGLLGVVLLLLIVSLSTVHWKTWKSDVGNSTSVSQDIGLWKVCGTGDSNKLSASSCMSIDSAAGVYDDSSLSALKTVRVMAILTLVFAGLALLLEFAEDIPAMQQMTQQLPKMLPMILLALASLLSIVVISVYASKVKPISVAGMSYDLGYSYVLQVVAMIGLLICTALAFKKRSQ